MKSYSAARKTTALITAALTVGSLGACSSAGSGNTASGDGELSGTIEVWTRSNPESAATYEQIFEAFTEKTGVEVDYQPIEDFDTRLQARASQKDLPDVMINDGGSLGNYVSQGFLLPIERESVEGQSDIPEETWEQNKGTDGAYYGVPWSRQANATVIRKDWRENVGMDVPKTWEELEELAQAFATEDPDGNGQDDTYGMVVPGSAKSGYIARWGNSYIWQAGGDFLEDNGDGTYTSVVNSAETATGMEFIRTQFCTPGSVVPGSVNLTTAETPFFPEGTAGIYLTGPYNLSGFDAAVGKENVEVIPMPAGPVASTTFAEGENIYFGAGSEMAEEQKALAEFLISPEAQELGMQSEKQDSGVISQPVVRLPVNSNVDIAAVYGDERWQTIADDYESDAKLFPWAIDFLPFRQILADGMNRVVTDCSSDIGAELETIDEGFQSELENQGLAQ